MLNNNRDLRMKVTNCAVNKIKSDKGLKYSDLLIFFDDLSVLVVLERIFRRK